jgi:hypothetical protein
VRAPAGNPPAYYIEQQSNIWGGPDVATDPTNPGAILVRTGNPSLPAAHADQPSNWTDYRLTAVIRSHDDDAIGLVARYQDASNHYLFAMDRERDYRRLVRVAGGIYTELAADSVAYDLDSDMTVSLECIGSRLRVFVDGELLFDVTDKAHASGSVGLYSAWRDVAVSVRLRNDVLPCASRGAGMDRQARLLETPRSGRSCLRRHT